MTGGYLGMDLPRFLALLRARWRLMAAITGAAMLLALVFSLAQPDRYEASADLLFGRTTNADAIIAGGATDTGDVPERTAATNLALASLDTVAVRVADRFPRATAAELKNSVSIEAAGDSDVVTVTAERGSAREAAAVANAFAAAIAAFTEGYCASRHPAGDRRTRGDAAAGKRRHCGERGDPCGT